MLWLDFKQHKGRQNKNQTYILSIIDERRYM